MNLKEALEKVGEHMECMVQVSENTHLGYSNNGNLIVVTAIEENGVVMVNDLGPTVDAAVRIMHVLQHFVEDHASKDEHNHDDEEESEVNETALAAMVPVGGVH